MKRYFRECWKTAEAQYSLDINFGYIGDGNPAPTVFGYFIGNAFVFPVLRFIRRLQW